MQAALATQACDPDDRACTAVTTGLPLGIERSGNNGIGLQRLGIIGRIGAVVIACERTAEVDFV